jgi:hypothetical protein
MARIAGRAGVDHEESERERAREDDELQVVEEVLAGEVYARKRGARGWR